MGLITSKSAADNQASVLKSPLMQLPPSPLRTRLLLQWILINDIEYNSSDYEASKDQFDHAKEFRKKNMEKIVPLLSMEKGRLERTKILFTNARN